LMKVHPASQVFFIFILLFDIFRHIHPRHLLSPPAFMLQSIIIVAVGDAYGKVGHL
jgi:hypothetical protein